MTAKLISITNQKGGAGKTTVSIQLAGSLAEHGRVLLVDSDEQGSASRWVSMADDDKPYPATVISMAPMGAKLHKELVKLIDDYDYIIIDLPPAVLSEVPQAALLLSDLALIPVVPDPVNLWAMRGIEKLVQHIRLINKDLQGCLLLNNCPSRSSLAKMVEESLEEMAEQGLPLLNSRLGCRAAYKESQLYGTWVGAMTKSRAGKAQEEVQALKNEVLALLAL